MDEDLQKLDLNDLIAEVKKLRNAIRQHRDSTGHDLCWHQPEMWALLPEGVDLNIAVPPWSKFMRGCVKYRQSLDTQAANTEGHDDEFKE